MSVEKFKGEIETTVSKDRRDRNSKKTFTGTDLLGEPAGKKTVRAWGFIGRLSFDRRLERAKLKIKRKINKSNKS